MDFALNTVKEIEGYLGKTKIVFVPHTNLVHCLSEIVCV